jgi:hypothetical protein
MDKAYFTAGDLEALASSDAKDGAADVAYFSRQRTRDEAHTRARHFGARADHARRMACEYLAAGAEPSWRDVAMAVRWARVAKRIGEWEMQAWGRTR